MNIVGIKEGSAENGNWKVFVRPSPFRFDVNVYLINRETGRTRNATIKDGVIVLEELKEGDFKDPQPFLQVPQDVWQLIIDAMTETTPPTKKERIEGELEATKYHLEDLRKILKI